MQSLIATFAILFGLMVLTLAVDRLYKAFAARNPDRGPFRDKDKGCQSCSACGSHGSCDSPAKER